MTRTLATDLFREMVSRPPEQVDLAAAALLIALDEYPGLNVSGYLERMKLVSLWDLRGAPDLCTKTSGSYRCR